MSAGPFTVLRSIAEASDTGVLWEMLREAHRLLEGVR